MPQPTCPTHATHAHHHPHTPLPDPPPPHTGSLRKVGCPVYHSLDVAVPYRTSYIILVQPLPAPIRTTASIRVSQLHAHHCHRLLTATWPISPPYRAMACPSHHPAFLPLPLPAPPPNAMRLQPATPPLHSWAGIQPGLRLYPPIYTALQRTYLPACLAYMPTGSVRFSISRRHLSAPRITVGASASFLS